MRRDLGKLQYLTDIEESLSLTLSWQKKSDNPELKKLSDNLMRISFYVNSLELEGYSYNTFITEFRHDKVRAVERARKADEKVEELEKELAKYKMKEKLGL